MVTKARPIVNKIWHKVIRTSRGFVGQVYHRIGDLTFLSYETRPWRSKRSRRVEPDRSKPPLEKPAHDEWLAQLEEQLVKARLLVPTPGECPGCGGNPALLPCPDCMTGFGPKHAANCDLLTARYPDEEDEELPPFLRVTASRPAYCTCGVAS